MTLMVGRLECHTHRNMFLYTWRVVTCISGKAASATQRLLWMCACACQEHQVEDWECKPADWIDHREKRQDLLEVMAWKRLHSQDFNHGQCSAGLECHPRRNIVKKPLSGLAFLGKQPQPLKGCRYAALDSSMVWSRTHSWTCTSQTKA